MSEQAAPGIAEKVRFWEEQDKINQAVIPRIVEMHTTVVQLSARMAEINGQLAASEARLTQRMASAQEHRPGAPTAVAYAGLALAATACALSLYQFLT